MTTILYDIETNGLLDEITTLHCIVTVDTDTEEYRVCHNSPQFLPCDGTLEEGVAYLGTADRTAGHNILEYDSPALAKLGYVDRTHVTQDRTRMIDTTVLSRLVYSDRKERDWALLDKGKIERASVARHSLGSWGDRLGYPKGESPDDWSVFTQDMLTYCIRDVEVNLRLYNVLKKRIPSFEAAGMTTDLVEHRFAGILSDMESTGVQLDRGVADNVLARLRSRRAELAEKIQAAFPPRRQKYAVNKKTGKQTYRRCPETGELKDHKLVPFNPGSRPQLAARLQASRGWVPKELTKKGNPIMQEAVLTDLASVYPEVGDVAEWDVCNRRISVLEDGPSGYFRLCDENDILHGRTLHIGTVTHRCAHSKPNTGNVTAKDKPYGKELRQVFRSHKGYIQAGYDADGLEQRTLADALHPFDGGSYATSLLEGSKAAGTDPHSRNAAAIGEVVPTTRKEAKRDFYAVLYGAGDEKLGRPYGKGPRTGRKIRNALINGIKGLKELLAALEEEHKANGGSIFLKDGRRVGVRSQHVLLNSKLQGNGAVAMRWQLLFLEDILKAKGIRRGFEWLPTGAIHDEVQASLRPGLESEYTSAVHAAFERATDCLGFRVPLTGSVDYGLNWYDCH